MSKTAADILIDTIHLWGVNVVFGLPGDGINGIMEALRKRQEHEFQLQLARELQQRFYAPVEQLISAQLLLVTLCISNGDGSLYGQRFSDLTRGIIEAERRL